MSDKLTAYKGDVYIPVYGSIADAQVYLKDKVDAVIAELKAENERLKATPEEIMKEIFDKVLIYPPDMVRLQDAYRLAVSLRKAKRVLWLARAERAKAWFLYWCARFGVESGFTKCDINGNFMNTKRTLRIIRDWMNLWQNVERKCRAKAEEYK